VKNPSFAKMGLNLLSILILVVGLGSAALVYQRAEDEAGGVPGYERGEESVYPDMPGHSKKYLRDLELYGGKANVLATELRLWVAGLFQGKTLAFTLTCITLLTSFVVFYVANHLPGGRGPDAARGDDSTRAG
jgi:hypothetical protein